VDFSHLKYLVVGSGFFGTTIAERIARDLGERVVIIEKRNHIGGNSFTSKDSDTGIECHHYGTHVFHTSNECVWQYIKNFSEFNNYRHRVLSKFGDKTYPIPVNLNTINTFYQENFNTDQAVAFMEKKQAEENYENPVSLEQKAISQMGRDLYEALIRGYSLKQWGKDPSALPPEIMNRIPIRFNKENQYFEDDWQGIPIEGFGQLIQSMLHHPNIQVYLNTDFFNIQELVPDDCLIFFSGPIDRFFHYQYGRLEWRSLTFEKKLMNIPDYQGIAVMNYAKASVLYTRIHEFKHLTPEKPKSNQTMIALEYPKDCTAFDDPFYPINTPSNQKVYEKYVEASRLKNQVIFGGRLGSYSYLNMDRAVEMALHIYQTKVRGIQ
jgi:UDP-galactopyranose mutase